MNEFHIGLVRSRGTPTVISRLKYLYSAIVLLLISSISFAQVFPSLEPYYSYASNAQGSTLSAHEMITTGLSFSEYPMVDQRKYMNIYLDLEQQVTSRTFMSMSERERAEAVLTLMYEKKLWKYQKNQTKLTTLLEDGTYNCVSASVLYSALAKAAGLTVIGHRASDHCFCSVLIGVIVNILLLLYLDLLSFIISEPTKLKLFFIFYF